MKKGHFSVEALSLSKALSRAQLVVDRRCMIPILANVRIRRRDASTLEISGTDFDRQVNLTCAAEVGEGVGVCVEPRRLAALLRLLGSERVMFEQIGRDLTLSWEGGRARLPTLPVDDFPDMTLTGEVRRGVTDPAFVSDVLMRVRPAISTEETRYYLNGIAMDGLGDVPMAVATDGHRLLCGPAPKGLMPALKGKSYIISRAFVETWIALGRGEEAGVSFYGDAKIQVVTGGVEIIGKMIDGNYPDWRRVLPKDGARQWEAPRAALKIALQRLATLSVERSPAATFLPGAALRVQATSMGGQDGALEITVEGSVSDMTEPRGQNLNYLRQAVDATKGATVRFMQARPCDPALVVGSDDEPASHVVVMGLRVTGADAFAIKPETLKRVA